MLCQAEGAARHYAAQVAHAFGTQAALAQGLHAQACQVLALPLGLVGCLVCAPVGLAVVAAAQVHFVATPKVHVLLGVAGGTGCCCLCGQGGAWAGVVVFAGCVAAAGQTVQRAKAVDVFAVDLVAQRVEGDLVVGAGAFVVFALRALEGAVVVAPDQAVYAATVFKVVVDAPFLHQPGDEFKVGFVVLDGVVALGVVLNQALIRGKRVVAQYRLDDFYRALVLKHLAVGGECGQVQPGAQGDFIHGVAAFFADEACGCDQAGDFAHTGALVGCARATGQAGCKGALAFEFDGAG